MHNNNLVVVENGDDDDLDYDSDGMQRDREFEELERREQEEHLRSSKIPTLAEHRFEDLWVAVCKHPKSALVALM